MCSMLAMIGACPYDAVQRSAAKTGSAGSERGYHEVVVARHQHLDVLTGTTLGNVAGPAPVQQPPANCSSCGCRLSIYRDEDQLLCWSCQHPAPGEPQPGVGDP